jgi:hypothetical protein
VALEVAHIAVPVQLVPRVKVALVQPEDHRAGGTAVVVAVLVVQAQMEHQVVVVLVVLVQFGWLDLM